MFKKFWASTPDGVGDHRCRAVRLADRSRPGRQRRQRLRPARRHRHADRRPAPDAGRRRRTTPRTRRPAATRRRRRRVRGELRPDDASSSAPPTRRPRRPAGSPPSCRRCSTAPARRRWSATSPRRPCSCRASGTPCSASSRPTPTPRAIAANGATVAVTWYNGGHDGGSPGRRDRDPDHRVVPALPAPAPGRSRPPPSGTPSTGRSATPAGPAAAPWRRRRTRASAAGRRDRRATPIPVTGDPQFVVNPPGASPAVDLHAARACPGSRRRRCPRSSAACPDRPRGSPRRPFERAHRDHRHAADHRRRSPSVPVPAACRAAQPARGRRRRRALRARWPRSAEGGTRSLAGGAVAPIRLTNLPADGTPGHRHDRPAGRRAAGGGRAPRIEVNLSTTDQAFAGPTAPAAYRIALADDGGAGRDAPGAVSAPEVGGVRVSASEIPVGQLIGLIVLAVARRARPGLRRTGARAGAPTSTPTWSTSRCRSPAWASPIPAACKAVTDVSFRVEAGPGARPARAERRRQDHHAADGDGADLPDRRRDPGVRPQDPSRDRRSCPGSAASSRAPASCRTCPARRTWSCTGRRPADRRRTRTWRRRWRSPGSGTAINRRVRTYSQGMRQRLAIAQAMLGLPDLLLMDEPTNGLDPPQIHAMREVLRRYAATGRTVLVSSHLLSEVEQTCTPRRRRAPGQDHRVRHGRRAGVRVRRDGLRRRRPGGRRAGAAHPGRATSRSPRPACRPTSATGPGPRPSRRWSQAGIAVQLGRPAEPAGGRVPRAGRCVRAPTARRTWRRSAGAGGRQRHRRRRAPAARRSNGASPAHRRCQRTAGRRAMSPVHQDHSADAAVAVMSAVTDSVPVTADGTPQGFRVGRTLPVRVELEPPAAAPADADLAGLHGAAAGDPGDRVRVRRQHRRPRRGVAGRPGHRPARSTSPWCRCSSRRASC